MIEADEFHHRIDLHSNASSPPSSSQSPIPNGTSNFAVRPKQCSLITLVLSCTVAAGVQFGWALQLSLLTPYIQVFFFALISRDLKF